MSKINLKPESANNRKGLSTYNLKGGVQECFTCKSAINQQTVYTRFHHKFCSEDCLEIFDVRNDFGHEKQYHVEEEMTHD